MNKHTQCIRDDISLDLVMETKRIKRGYRKTKIEEEEYMVVHSLLTCKVMQHQPHLTCLVPAEINHLSEVVGVPLAIAKIHFL